MHKSFINNALYRVFVPLFFGITVYILILLINDSVTHFIENYITIEVLLCVLISYFLNETHRIGINFTNKICDRYQTNSCVFVLQPLTGVVLSVLITTLITFIYFKMLVGLYAISNYIVIFNAIYLFGTIILFLTNISFRMLQRNSETILNLALQEQKSIGLKQKFYKTQINQEFLNQSLEALLGLVKKSPERADQFISNLSEIYRTILTGKKDEPILLRSESSVLAHYNEVLNEIYCNQISINQNYINENHYIVPGTLIIVVEHLIRRTIIDQNQPFKIELDILENNIIVECAKNDKLNYDSKNDTFDLLNKHYTNFTGREITISESDHFLKLAIPLIYIETDN